jgi:hypothetical protein
MGGPVGRPGKAEDIGDLDRGSQRLSHPVRPLPTLNMPRLSGGLITVRTVRVATLV